MDSREISIYMSNNADNDNNQGVSELILGCRICFEPAITEDPLVRPCKCHSKVHISCLERWRTTEHNGNSMRNVMCEVCHYRYQTVSNPMNTSPCTMLYTRVNTNIYHGSCPGNNFKLMMFHIMCLIVISGIFYGADYTRYIESHLPIVGESYRIYYDLSFASYASLSYLLQLFELHKLSCREWAIYLKYIFNTLTPAHVWLLFHITCCIAIGSYMWKSVAFDIICTIPFYHITCILHSESRKEVENSICIGSIKEYTEDDD
jgi:E3 ubiquitin-protein ligase DOA10